MRPWKPISTRTKKAGAKEPTRKPSLRKPVTRQVCGLKKPKPGQQRLMYFEGGRKVPCNLRIHELGTTDDKIKVHLNIVPDTQPTGSPRLGRLIPYFSMIQATISLFGRIIEQAATIDDDAKEALITEIGQNGWTPETEEKVLALFRREELKLGKNISESEEIQKTLKEVRDAEDPEAEEIAATVIHEFEKEARMITDEFTAVCDREIRSMESDIEGHTKKGEASEMDAIRTFLQKK